MQLLEDFSNAQLYTWNNVGLVIFVSCGIIFLSQSNLNAQKHFSGNGIHTRDVVVKKEVVHGRTHDIIPLVATRITYQYTAGTQIMHGDYQCNTSSERCRAEQFFIGDSIPIVYSSIYPGTSTYAEKPDSKPRVTAMFYVGIIGLILAVIMAWKTVTLKTRDHRLMVQFFAFLEIILSLGLAAYTIIFYKKANRSKFWPKVNGVVRNHDIKEYQGSSSGYSKPTYRPVVEYEYVVNGVAYSNDAIDFRFSPIATANYNFAMQLTLKYKKGDEVQVFTIQKNLKSLCLSQVLVR